MSELLPWSGRSQGIQTSGTGISSASNLDDRVIEDNGFGGKLGRMNLLRFAMRHSSPARLIAAWAAIWLLVPGASAEANPFARFLYSVRHLHHQHAASDRHKRVGEAAPSAGPEIGSVRPDTTQQNSAEPLHTSASRDAALSPARKDGGRQLPAGIPVPNKPGFLRSPYAQNQAVIDVRGFPSGTPVKDPFTGRTFVTP